MEENNRAKEFQTRFQELLKEYPEIRIMPRIVNQIEVVGTPVESTPAPVENTEVKTEDAKETKGKASK